MARSWWRRKRVWVPAAALVLAAGSAAAIVLPNLPAMRFLGRMSGPEPSADWAEPRTRGARSGGFRLDTRDPGGGGPYELRVPASEDDEGCDVVVAHGITADGIRDPRLWRLAAAFEDAGLAARVPELDSFVSVEGPRLAQSIDGDTDSLERGRERGFLGISVGASLVLRAAAKASRDSARRPSALLLIGALDDVTAAAREWFRRPDSALDDSTREASLAKEGRFARHVVLRFALDALVSDEADRSSIRSWLQSAPSSSWRLPPLPADGAFRSPEARRLAAAAVAGATITGDDVEWILYAADPVLQRLSPARFDAELDALRCPVFLLHGADDPLVPREQMERLRTRLAKRVRVEVLESRILSHVGIEEPSFREKWRHVRFVQRFFDAVSDPD